MNKAALKNELTDDPLGRGYSGMSDSAAAGFDHLCRIIPSCSAENRRKLLKGWGLCQSAGTPTTKAERLGSCGVLAPQP